MTRLNDLTHPWDEKGKKKNLVQLRFTDDEYALLKQSAEVEGRDMTSIVRCATYDIVTKVVPVKIKGQLMTLTILEARELVKDLLAKVY